MNKTDLMHGVDWDGESPIEGMLAQEKYDGIRAVWTGDWLMSKGGHRIDAPAWFTAGLPLGTQLDAELVYLPERGPIVPDALRKRGSSDRRWGKAMLMVFDVIVPMSFSGRGQLLPASVKKSLFADFVPPRFIGSLEELRTTLRATLALGGEGLILRDPDSLYVPGRCPRMLKVKAAQMRWLKELEVAA